MKYLILIQSNPEWRAAFASFTPEQQAEGMALYTRVFDELQESGELVDAEQLAGPETVRAVTVGEHGPVATDAPLAETKEFLGGYYLVDVESFDRAVEIAARFPEAAQGMIRIHPVMTADAPADTSAA
ncbi:YciI family protein [Agromyces arachidis]|uniref:YciI family protein n=1 Tax=Agromyces arachidis TaxID=766966 RepID=UPI004056EDFF